MSGNHNSGRGDRKHSVSHSRDVRFDVAEQLSKSVAQMFLEKTSNASPTNTPPPPPEAIVITPSSVPRSGTTHRSTPSPGHLTTALSSNPTSYSCPMLAARLEQLRRSSITSSTPPKLPDAEDSNVPPQPNAESGGNSGATLEYLGQLASHRLRCLGAKCEHVSCWKRLRAKKGRGYYACQQCGVRWSVPTSRNTASGTCTSSSADAGMFANEMRSLMAIADSVNEEAQKLLGSSVTSLTESIAASNSGEVDLLGVSLGSSHLTQGSGSTHCISVLESKTSSVCTTALMGVATCSESNRDPSSSEQRRPSDGCAEGESVPTACWHLPSFLLQQLAQPYPTSVSEVTCAEVTNSPSPPAVTSNFPDVAPTQ